MTGLLDNTSSAGQDKGRTPLACVAEAGHIDTVAKLLAGAHGFDIDARDYDGCTSLALASQKGHTAVVEQLLAHGANPNLRDLNQITPLWHAARYGHTAIVRILLDSRQISDVNSRPTYPHKNMLDTPLSIAIKKGHQKTAELLSRADGICPSLRTGVFTETYWDNLSILGLATRSAFEDVTLALMDKYDFGHDFQVADSGDDDDYVENSDENGSYAEDSDAEDSGVGDPEAEDSDGKNYNNHDFNNNDIKEPMESVSELLVFAVVAGCSRLVQELLTTYGVDVNAIHGYSLGKRLGWVEDSPLMAASRRGDLNTVCLLLGLDEIRPGVSSKRSGSALTAAAQGGFVDVVKKLVADGRIEVDYKNGEGRTALSFAAENACEAVIAELLATGAADPNSQDNEGRTPLIWATDPENGYGPGGWQSYEGVTRRLLAHDQVAVNIQVSEGRTALSYSAKYGALGLVVALLERPEIDPMKGSEVRSPLGEAAANGHADVVQALLNTGRVDVNAVCDLFGSTALMLVGCCDVQHDVSTAQVLLSTTGIDVDFQDEDGKTALIKAASRGTVGMVKLLLASGADPSMQDHNGNTAISHAENIEIIKALLEAPGIKPDHPNNEGRTALSLAAEAGAMECVNSLLLINGVNPDARDIHGRGPLSWVFGDNGRRHRRRKEERKEVLRQLLRIPNVDPNAEDHKGLTPLLRAIMSDQGNEYVEILLSRQDLDVNRLAVWGRDSPLDTAKKVGNMGTVALLRARGANESVDSTVSLSLERSLTVEEGTSPGQNSTLEYTPPRLRHRQSLSQGSVTSSASSGSDFDYRPFVTQSLKDILRKDLLGEHHLHLGEQQTYIEEAAEHTSSMCASCSTIDLGSAFRTRHTQYGGRVIADLGRVDETWKKRTCPLCRLFATVYPRVSLEGGHRLVSFSTIQSWLCHGDMNRWSDLRSKRLADTILLAVVSVDLLGTDEEDKAQVFRRRFASPSRRAKWVVEAAFSSGLIGRLGSNGPCQGSVTIPQLTNEIDDWGVARSWITLCRENHPRDCNPPKTAPVPHFRLIECSTRKIIQQKESQTGGPPPYVALSYVWGKSQGHQKPPEEQSQEQSLDEYGGGRAEAVIEDAIRVTMELGYRYLWIDRYCVVQEGNEAMMSIKKEQLRHMHLVYANAEITLIAAAGKDASAGLPGAPGRPRKQPPSALIQNHALTCIPPDPSFHVRSNSTWAKRGWTYQEGLLSRRRLYFSEYEMSYECRHMLCREAIRLPRGLEQCISGHKPRFMEPFWMYQPYKLPGMDSSLTGIGLFDLLAVYSSRQLSFPSDTLNAMLGILSLLAQQKRNPIYHICGVPLLRLPDHKEHRSLRNKRKSSESGSNSDTDAATLGLGGFLNGLCWRLQEPAQRRPSFPSWSWTGWQGLVTGIKRQAMDRSNLDWDRCFNRTEQTYGFVVDISIIPGDQQGTVVVPWSRYYDQLRMVDNSNPDIVLGQNHILEITASAVTVRFRIGKYEDRPDTWIGTVCVGDYICQGEFFPTLQDVGDHETLLESLLLERGWTGIVLGNTKDMKHVINREGTNGIYLHDTTVLLIREREREQRVAQDNTYYERIGLLELERCPLNGSMLERQTWRVM
ncbi:hypothetical protein ACHAPI_007027 [Fusarium lateritium]